jgi:Cytochrome c bacterial/Putative metal-binding motif/Outer membrane cytochrome MtrC/MtrF-like, domains II/IV
MKPFFKQSIATAFVTLMFANPTTLLAGDGKVKIQLDQVPISLGGVVTITATGSDFKDPLVYGEVDIKNADKDKILDDATMTRVNDTTFTFTYTIPDYEEAGKWQVKCKLYTDEKDEDKKIDMVVVEGAETPPPPTCSDNDGDGFADAVCGGTDCNDWDPAINPGASEICDDGIDQNCSRSDLDCPVDPPPPTGGHQDIVSYEGPATCIACHEDSANEMLNSLHMQWSGPTPNLTNTNGESLGKTNAGMNTFCTYAVSSGGACFSCHVRSDGNAPHAPDINDVDCLMCHNDTYQRKTVVDPNNTETVTNVLGETKTYVFGAQDAEGNYSTVPNFDAMPAGTTMVDLARNVHMPTRKSCLRCHAKAGGGDWTKRGDMGLSTANPPLAEDIHMSPAGADLSCQACHATESGHKVGGRGIDLRQTESAAPTCQACHGITPHNNATINRHAAGQVSCQVCHIREFGKGGATEMSRDWLAPHWNPAFCNGQGGFVGHEIKEANVTPEYTWFDGTSYVYNLGETITPDEDGLYAMARANGTPFDGNSKIVPIKRHFTNTPLHESGQIIGPKIMRMFMTGTFDDAVQAGMQDMGLSGNYSMVDAYAEMLITHGVEPTSNAPTCAECHDGSGQTPDDTKMLPFTTLGYHQFPSSNMCSLCHDNKSMNWQDMHNKHVEDKKIDCASCHTAPPKELSSNRSSLCASCHNYESESDPQKIHKKHIKKNIACSTCHAF